MIPDSVDFVVAIDPGSHTSGVAVFERDRQVIHPAQSAVFFLQSFERVRAGTKARETPHDRCLRMANLVCSRARLTVPPPYGSMVDFRARALVVLESPGGQSGKQHARGLVTMGFMLGLLCAKFDALSPARFEMVEVGRWCRLCGPKALPKEERAKRVRKMFPQIKQIGDTSLDVADAVGLGAWRCGLFGNITPRPASRPRASSRRKLAGRARSKASARGS